MVPAAMLRVGYLKVGGTLMKFMIEAVMLKNAVRLFAYDYVLMVAGSRNYGDLVSMQLKPKARSHARDHGIWRCWRDT